MQDRPVRSLCKPLREVLFCLPALLPVSALAAGAAESRGADGYLPAVRAFADRALALGRDTYGPRQTPLFVDGLHVDTHEPATWVLPDDCAAVWKMPKRFVMCNLASQQNLFRTLDGLTALTGDPRYHEAAAEATRYALANLQYKDGLLFWGGHAMIDLVTDQPVGESHKDWSRGVPIPATWDTGVVHELKFHFPYYELMWQVNPGATRRFVLGFWAAHVQDWSNLDMNRHGIYGRSAGHAWDHEYLGGPVPFTGKGLSFIHTGSDLMYAAALLTEFTGDERPLTWARRLAGRYDQIRHPTTHLAADVYNYYRNERLLAQFGPEFGDRLTETTIASFYGGRYSYPAICLLKLAERIGPEGQAFRDLVLTDLAAFARHAYDPADNRFRAMLIDGTPLGPQDVKRPGSVTPDALDGRGAGGVHFWGYSLAAAAADDKLFWDMTRHIGRALGLGRMGNGLDSPPKPDLGTECADTYVLFALLDLHRATRQRGYLDLARRIGDNLLARQFHQGFFVPSADHVFARLDSVTPFALLHLEVALENLPVKLPPYYGGISYFHCDYEGQGRTYDGREIYSLTRKDMIPPATGQ